MSHERDWIIATDIIVKFATLLDDYVTFALSANRKHISVTIGNVTHELPTNEKLVSLLAKLRAIGKPIKWTFRLHDKFKLNEQKWFECLNNIENGDVIKINYYSEVYDDFVVLIDIIRKYNISKIFIDFYNRPPMDVVQFVSDVTKADIYYDASVNYVDESKFIRFED